MAVWNILSNLSQYEQTVNKVTEIDENSTDEQYPTAKAVYDSALSVANQVAKESEKKSNKVTILSEDNTDEQYLSAKAVYKAVTDINTTVDDKEDAANKITSITEDNINDTNFPTTQAVSDYISANTQTIYSSTTEPTSEDGKVGDLWVVIE